MGSAKNPLFFVFILRANIFINKNQKLISMARPKPTHKNIGPKLRPYGKGGKCKK